LRLGTISGVPRDVAEAASDSGRCFQYELPNRFSTNDRLRSFILAEVIMHRSTAFGLAAMMAIFAHVAVPAGAATPAGSISGVARDTRGGHLVNAGVRVRNAGRGNVVSETRTGTGGLFSASALQPGTYVVEALGQYGQVIGVSPAVPVIAGRTTTVTVMAGTAQSPQALSQAGFSLFGLGTGASIGIVAAVAAAAITTVAVVASGDHTASPSQ